MRACYLYSGVTDISALTGNKDYERAMRRVWNNIVRSRTYITGGIGSVAGHEGFGDPYVLPNRCYAETCGAVASGMWNHRMFLQHGHAKYIDVLERTIYNAFLPGISISGDRFFYRNPIASNGAERPDWYQCACCPANVARFVPSIGRYFYAVMGNAIYVNLYAASMTKVELGSGTVGLEQTTDYPWDGRVDIAVKPGKPRAFNLLVRIPGWARNEVMPHHLYTYANKPEASWTLLVNGEKLAAKALNGYAIIKRTWKDGDVVTLDLPMPVRRVKADKRVKANKDMIAIERGPIVYCFEAKDNGGLLTDIALDESAEFTTEHRKTMLGGITVIKGKAPRMRKSAKGELSARTTPVTAIPFYAWAHRGRTPMSVWMPATRTAAHPMSPPSIASRSRVTASYVHASIAAVNDQIKPRHASDKNVPWFDWWPKRNSTQWLQYDFESKARITKSSVHWYDDTPYGGCGLPQSWRLLYRKDGKWLPVEGASGYAVDQSRYSTVTFSPVTTDGLRLEAQLTKGVSAGVMEWAVE